MQKLRVRTLSSQTKKREEGHTSKECDKPLTEEFLATITCRRCGGTGHLGADCPEKPKLLCNNCGQEGHRRSECTVFSNPKPISSARSLPTWTIFNAKNADKRVILHETVPTRNAAIVSNQATLLVNVLYISLSNLIPFSIVSV